MKYMNFLQKSTVFGLILGLEIFFFYPYLFSDLLFAAPGDHRLNILIAEHWFRFYQGQEGLTELSMFYPSKHALAYSDLNLIFGLLMIFFKMAGISTYLASKIIFIGIHFIGSLAFFYFLKHSLKLKTLLCFLGLILFSYSNRYYAIIDLGHTQFITYSLIPFLLIFIFNFFNASSRHQRLINAIAGIGLYVLIFYTSFYTAFFITLFALSFSFFYLLTDSPIVISAARFIRKNALECLFYFLLITLTLLPLVFFYLPAATESGVHGRTFVSHFKDFLNVSPKHWLYGSVMSKMNLHPIMNNDGFPFLTFTLAIACGLGTIGRFIKNRHAPGLSLNLAFTAFITCFCAFLLIIRLNNISLWNEFILPIPGAEAIRFPNRYIGFQSIPCSILIAYTLNELYKTISGYSKTKTAFLIVLTALLFLENIRVNEPSWHYQSLEKFIHSIPIPPTDCKIIYATSSITHQYNNRNLDMFEIANRFHLKTINGYSGRKPFAYQYFHLDKDTEYLNGIQRYIDYYHLQNVCAYDFDTQQWEYHSK